MSKRMKSYCDNFVGVKVDDNLLELLKLGLQAEKESTKKNITLSSYIRRLLEAQLDAEIK